MTIETCSSSAPDLAQKMMMNSARGCVSWLGERKRFGSPRLHIMLKREGLVINHKRTERIYSEEGLALRRKEKAQRRGKSPGDHSLSCAS